VPIIRYGEALNVLVAAKGHPYSRDSFMAIFDGMEGIAATLVEQPAAARLMNPEAMSGFDALVLYDMPGLDFRVADPPRAVAPDPAFQEGLRALLDAGTGIVALHHAIAGWPAWEEYGDYLGGRFLYRPSNVHGRACADSGYRHEIVHEISLCDATHPVLEGIPERFTLTDELYLFETFDESLTPLLRSSYRFVPENFYSAAQAVAGAMYSNAGWDHAAGSNLVGWTKRARNSPLVYLQPGDSPSTYDDVHYRRLIANAIRWVASPHAQQWARVS
jgi:type 1 glutamine amidotransferase